VFLYCNSRVRVCKGYFHGLYRCYICYTLNMDTQRKIPMLRILHETDLPQLLVIEKLTQKQPCPAETSRPCWQAGYSGWVVEQEDKVLGFILATLHVGETHILNLCIHPDFQRRGYGRQLLVHLLDVAKEKGNGVAFLEVRRSNLGAIELYKNEGFVRIGERKNYYPSQQGREDALIFAKDLRVQ
jgi:[ribosomal protein S18]-alanine N-acetyltransferase